MRNGFFLLLFSTYFVFAGRVAVCIDPGHGGINAPGCVNPRYGLDGPYERTFNLEIANYCVDELWSWLTFSMTRTNDGQHVSPFVRVIIAKGEKQSAAIFS